MVQIFKKMKFNFKKKLVVITGGEGGIGKSISNQFVNSGANVIITTRNRNKLKEKNKKKNIFI